MYGIFAYIWVILRANVGKYSSTMEHMCVYIYIIYDIMIYYDIAIPYLILVTYMTYINTHYTLELSS